MNEENRNQESHGNFQDETDVVVLIKKMQQQLSFLEKKIDTLIAGQSQPKPFRDRNNFSRPFRPFNRPGGPGGQRHGGHSFGGGHDQGGRDRGPRPGGGHSSEGNFAPKKKPFFGRRRES